MATEARPTSRWLRILARDGLTAEATGLDRVVVCRRYLALIVDSADQIALHVSLEGLHPLWLHIALVLDRLHLTCHVHASIERLALIAERLLWRLPLAVLALSICTDEADLAELLVASLSSRDCDHRALTLHDRAGNRSELHRLVVWSREGGLHLRHKALSGGPLAEANLLIDLLVELLL